MNRKKFLKGACLITAASLLFLQTATAQEEDEGPSWSISGWINEGMTYWDDGEKSDFTQLSDNGTTLGSRITLAGSSDLPDTGLTAGFEVIVEVLSGDPYFANGGPVTPLLFANQDNLETFNGGDIGLLGTSAYISGAWGKITVGEQSMPTDNIAVLADPSLTIWSGISPVFRGNGFTIRGLGDGATNTTWGSFLQCLTVPGLGIGIDCNGVYRNGIRYDLPALGPVSVAVGYANDDVYDIAAKYNADIGRLKAMLHLGYAYNSDGGTNVGATDGADVFQVQGGLMDSETGLFGTLAFQVESADDTDAGSGDDTDAFYLKGGIKRNWFGFGDTALYVDFGLYNDQFGSGNVDGISGSEVQRTGLSIDQYFSNKLIMYVKYENLSLDVDGTDAARAIYNGAEDLDTVTVALVYFF